MADETPQNVGFSNPASRLKMSRSRPVRRHTPYTKTPRRLRKTPWSSATQRLPSGDPTDRDTSSPDNVFTNTEGVFKEFINKTWRVFTSSPLYDFNYVDSSLKKYGNDLSKFLSTESKVASRGNGKKYKGVLEVIHNVGLNEGDNNAVRVTVSTHSENKKDSKSVILSMIFFSVGRDEDLDLVSQNKAVILPVCLAKGQVAIIRDVQLWFSRKFGCKITPAKFSPSHLSQLAAMWASVGKRPIELNYNLPDSVTGLKTIKYTIDGDDAKYIWDEIVVDQESDFIEDKETVFMKALEEHFYHHFKINLSALQLVTIATGLACIGCEGRLKIVDASYVQHVLLQIMHFCK